MALPMPDWSALLLSCREYQKCPQNLSAREAETFLAHFPSLNRLLTQYASDCSVADILDDEKLDSQRQLDDGWADESSSNENEVPEIRQRKGQVLKVRRALRFGLSCISLGHRDDADSSILKKIQRDAISVCNMHRCLSRLLSLRSTDQKSRTLAAKLLSNLVTANAETAAVVANDVALSPTELSKSRAVSLALGLAAKENVYSDVGVEISNWVDMILASTRGGDRASLAAVIAALHNCIASLNNGMKIEPVSEEEIDISPLPHLSLTQRGMAASISADRILMCNIVRHILPVGIIKPVVLGTENTKLEDQEKSSTNSSGPDDATEWISLFLEKVTILGESPILSPGCLPHTTSRMKNFASHVYSKNAICKISGFFPQMYASVGGRTNSKTISPNSKSGELVTPEQVVLIHCLSGALEQSTAPSSTRPVWVDPLGGDGGQEAVTNTHLFLSKQAGIIREAHVSKGVMDAPGDNYTGEADCRTSIYLEILSMLATSLAGENDADRNWKGLTRMRLGQETLLLSSSLADLGVLVDRLSKENHGRKARELAMSGKDQRLITVIVRLIGNLCFRCKQNQDMLRNVVVLPKEKGRKREETSSIQNGLPNTSRTGLHVLLSCTSFSYGCFTLREWAIVAIRNALEGNEANQRLVERLEAQEAVQTPELQKLGLTIDIDGRGKACIQRELDAV